MSWITLGSIHNESPIALIAPQSCIIFFLLQNHLDAKGILLRRKKIKNEIEIKYLLSIRKSVFNW